ncbi:Cyclin-dependent kinases regulatory subunit 1 [Coemansia sp. RSA 2559]|nr:Cyclin-dependent kinases regulatory subunit 1 [Coemansia sp. RSA 2559]KAJ2869435.1 Cyclin-dependent kinases regulatory subunit 1 [Coemansia erecta]
MMPLPAKLKNGGEPAATFHKLTAEEQKRVDIAKYAVDIYYSDRYSDDECEYRHVSLPEGLRKYLPNPPRLMTEAEWRGLGVRQSPGWEHYMVHEPEPHVLLFKRQMNCPP